jgi:hypothetical protein
MSDINKIEVWYNNYNSQYNFQYNSHNIFLIYLKEDSGQRRIYSNTERESENDRFIIKQLVTIKSSDIDNSVRSNKQLILYFDKPMRLIDLSILKHSNYSYVYFDLDINQSLFIFKYFEPTNIIQNRIEYIKRFFEIFLSSNKDKKSIFNLTQINTFLLRNKKNISLETILKDIIFLEHHNKLTSRLAIFIYKICTFEFNAGEKEIGLYFSQHFGKSKPLNKKSYGIQNVKGYDIIRYPNNPICNTKVQIANILSNMINKPINRNTILDATGIDINVYR